MSTMTLARAIERRAQELLAELAGIDPGDDTLGVVVRLALRDNPDATADDVRAIWRDAAEEYAAERSEDGRSQIIVRELGGPSSS
jgi:hypothetical protein